MKDEEKKLILNQAVGLLKESTRKQDGQGYNKYDRKFVEDLIDDFNKKNDLSLSQWKSLTELLLKYRNQLHSLGFNPEELTKITFGRVQKQGDIGIGVGEDYIKIDCPFNQDWLDEFKSKIPVEFRTWNNQGKIWKVEAKKEEIVQKAINITEKHFDVEIDIELPDVPFGKAYLKDNRIALDTEHDDELKERVKTFAKREYDNKRQLWTVEPISIQEVEKIEGIFDDYDIEINPEVYGYLEEKWIQLKEQKEKEEKISRLSQKRTVEEDYFVELPDDDLSLYPFQKHGVRILNLRKKGLIADEMGCVSGNSNIIPIVKNQDTDELVYCGEISIKNFYSKFNQEWKKERYKIFLLSFSSKSEKLVLNGVNNVLSKGIKDTMDIILEDKKEIQLTPDHEVKTKDGWTEAKNLDVLEKIFVAPDIQNPRNTSMIPNMKRITNIKEKGKQEVYDIVMEEPYRNFVANGIIVHNCGKTIQVLAHLYNQSQKRPVIVIAPSSVKINWKREITKWTEAEIDDIYVLHGEEGKIPKDQDWYIVNYAILHHRLENLKTLDFEVLVIDESHYVKNKDTLRTKATKELSEQTDNVYCLTGTPMPNRPVELWPQLEILKPSHPDFQTFWGNEKYKGFAKKYCGATKTLYGWDVKGAKNLSELQEELKKNIMIRRKKEDVLEELPEKQRFHISMEIDNRDEYNRAMNNFAQWIEEKDDSLSWSKAKIPTKLEKLKQLVWKGKYDNMVDWIKDAMTQTDKIVIFAHHRDLQSKLYEEFEEDGVHITGGMSPTQKQDIIDEFTEEDSKLAIVSLQAGGSSINLQVSSTLVFSEIGWTPSQMQQAEDRVHRIGQEAESVDIYYLMAENTIEETIFEVIDRKQAMIDEAIDGIEDDSKKGVIMQALEEEFLSNEEE